MDQNQPACAIGHGGFDQVAEIERDAVRATLPIEHAEVPSIRIVERHYECFDGCLRQLVDARRQDGTVAAPGDTRNGPERIVRRNRER